MTINRRSFIYSIVAGTASAVVTPNLLGAEPLSVEIAPSTSPLSDMRNRQVIGLIQDAMQTAFTEIMEESSGVNDEVFRRTWESFMRSGMQIFVDRKVIWDFVVRCDGVNNSPAIIDANGFAGNVAIRFRMGGSWVDIGFTVTTESATFEDLLS